MVHSGRVTLEPALTRLKRGERWPPAPPYSEFSTSLESSFARLGVAEKRGDIEHVVARVPRLTPDLGARALRSDDARPDSRFRSDHRHRERH